MNFTTSETSNIEQDAVLKPRVPPRAWYALAVITLIYSLHAVDRSVMSVVIEPIKKEFGLSDSQLGVLTGLAFGLTYAIAGLPLGYMIDRVNRRRLLAGLLTVWSGCTALCGIVQSYTGLVAARLAVGLAEAGAAPTAVSLISDLFPSRRRSTAMAIFWASTALGTAASFILGSKIAVHYGWRAAFLVAGLPGLALAGILFFTVAEPPREKSAAGERIDAPSLSETLRHVLRQPVFVHIFIALTLNSMMLSGLLVWQGAFLIRIHHLSLEQAGRLAGYAALIFGGLGSLAGGPIGDRAFRRGGLASLPLVSAFTTLASVVTGVVFTNIGNLTGVIGALVVFELLARTYTAPGYSALVGSVEPRMRGICIAALQIATNLIGYGLGPYLVGLVSDYAGGPQGLRWGLLTLMLTGLWASIHYVFAWRAAASGAIRTGEDA